MAENWPTAATSVTLAEGSPADLIESMESDRLEASFIRHIAELEGLVCHLLLEDPLVVALPKGHALARDQARAVLPLKRLSDETFIVNRGAGPVRDAIACPVAGFSPRVGQEAPHVISMLPLVAAGIGIAIVPASLQRMNIRAVVYRRLTGSTHLKVPLTLVSRRGEASAVVRQFVDLVRRSAKDHHGT
jgi:DNA-binding transcriptional LysR family regulator